MAAPMLLALGTACTVGPLEVMEIERELEPDMVRAGTLCVSASLEPMEATRCAVAQRRPWRASSDPRPPLRLGVLDPGGLLLSRGRRLPPFTPEEAERRNQAYVPAQEVIRYQSDDVREGLLYAGTLWATQTIQRGLTRAIQGPDTAQDEPEAKGGELCFEWFVRADPSMATCGAVVERLGDGPLLTQLGRLRALSGPEEAQPAIEEGLADCALGR